MKRKILPLLFLVLMFSIFTLASCNNKNNAHECEFGEWQTQTEATCTEHGIRYCKCTICGKTQTTTFTIRHTESKWIIDENASCLKAGSKHKECTVCHEILKIESISTTGHTESEWIIDENASCLKAGSKHKECTVCHETIKTENISATGHTESEWIIDENASCMKAGSKHKECTVCHETIKTESISANHIYTETLTIRNCATPAKISYVCQRCSHKYEEEIASIELTLINTGKSSILMNGYGNFSFTYSVTASGGYGKILYKYELYKNATADKPSSTIDFTENTAITVSYKGLEETVNDYVYKITAKDNAGNLSIYSFSLKDCSVMKFEDKSTVDHSYENKTCICGRDITYDAIATFDISSNQDGSVIAYLLKANDSQKLYIFGNGAIKNYSWSNSPFYNNKKITEVYIGNGVTTLGDYLFYYCTALKNITIPNGVTSIGESTFYGCYSLTSITISNGVTSIGKSAFYDCSKLTEIHYNAENCADLSSSNRIFYNAGKDGNGIKVTISASVQNIPAYLFNPSPALSAEPNIIEVTFEGNSVCESIGDYAFYNCTDLTVINYSLTEEKWNAITKGTSWDSNTGKYTLNYNYNEN